MSFEQLPASTDVLAQISTLADERVKQAMIVEKYEEALKVEKEKLRVIEEESIPELMEQVGLEKVTTRSGLVVEVKDKISASIPVEQRQQAYHWLRSNGFGDLIKHVVVAKFGMEQDDEAHKALELLSEKGYDVADEQSVHSQSLSAFAREQIAAGNNIPMELLGVRRTRIAKIK